MSRIPKSALVLLLSCAGAASANAEILIFDSPLTGSQEVPPNSSPGIGFAHITFDTATHILGVRSNFTGLSGATTASHIHVIPLADPLPPTGGVATQLPNFLGFPLGVTSGSFVGSFDMRLASSYNPAFVTANGDLAGAEAAFVAALLDGRAYYNIHTAAIPSGELRGNLTAVPEPGTWALMIGGFALAGTTLRRARAKVAFA